MLVLPLDQYPTLNYVVRMTLFEPIQKQSVSDAVFSQLRAQILAGRLAAGVALPAERTLCQMLGVNRGAVREAIRRLQEARLVSVQHGGATRVLSFLDTSGPDLLAELLVRSDGGIETKVVRSMLEVRAALAPDVARLCAARGGVKAADALDGIVESMVAAGSDAPKLHALVFDFWDALVNGADNIAYRLIFNSLRQVYGKVQNALTYLLLDELTQLDSYRQIAAAVRGGDGSRAADEAARLIELGGRQIAQLLDAMDGSTGGRK